MMALGLNIVVGYAGLLDLGYVAFYAAGAYIAGWLASLQFEDVTFHLVSAASGDVPGIHISMWLVLVAAGAFTAAVGIAIGLPTLRLRGDYLAIVTLGFGEIVPQFVRNADSLGGFNLTGGTFGIAPIDSFAIGGFVFREQSNKDDLHYWSAIGPHPLHGLLLHAPPRLAARQRVDRDPRGRDGRRRDGRPAHADEDLVLRDRRFLRRHRGRFLRELPGRCVPGRLLLQLLRSSCSAWSSSAGWARSGVCSPAA